MRVKNKTRRRWTDKEIAYLKENYGNYLDVTVAKRLGRSIDSVRVKAKRLHLHPFKVANGEYISICQLAEILKVDPNVLYRWNEKYSDFPAVSKKIYHSSCLLIKFDSILPWLKKHQDIFSAKNIEPFSLGKEPDWLKKKRAEDFNISNNSGKYWTKREEDYLLHLCRQGKTIEEIAKIMGRSSAGIRNKKKRLLRSEYSLKKVNFQERR